MFFFLSIPQGVAHDAPFFFDEPRTSRLIRIGDLWLRTFRSTLRGNHNYITNAVGANDEFNQHLIVGVCYEYQLSNRTMILNNQLLVQAILRY